MRTGADSATVSPVAALDGDPDLKVLNGEARPFSEWLTTFPMVLAAIDPFTHESSWLLGSIHRIFHHYREAGVRVAWLVTGPDDGVTKFLATYSDDFLTFVDPNYAAVRALGLSTLPAFVLIKQDGSIAATAEGWNPAEWSAVSEAIETITSWTPITIPGPNDPSPYAGTSI